MRKILLSLALGTLAISPLAILATIRPSSPPCGGTSVVVTQTIDKTSVNPGDSCMETVTIYNFGPSQGVFTVIDRLEDMNDVYDLTTHMDTVVLDPGKSRTLYRVYTFPCAAPTGVYTINNRTLTGGNVYTPACVTNNAFVNITSTPVCPGG